MLDLKWPSAEGSSRPRFGPMGGTPLPLRQVQIGDQVVFDGRLYVLRGMDPMSVPDRAALLEDARTGELVRAPYAEVEPAENRPGFHSEGLG